MAGPVYFIPGAAAGGHRVQVARKHAQLPPPAAGGSPSREVRPGHGARSVVTGVVGAALGLAAAVTVIGVAVALWPLAKIGQLVNQYVTEPLAEKRFHNAHRTQLDALAQPKADSLVKNGRAMDLLYQHAGIVKARNACDTGGRMGRDELARLVATGERLVTALDVNALEEGNTVAVTTAGGQRHHIACSAYGARAISWYLMAVAAREQIRSPRPLPRVVEQGAYVLKDPDRKLYRFLSACPTARARPSSHFNERADHDQQNILGGVTHTNKSAQRRIDDFRSRMPGDADTMLFDTLRSSNGDGIPELLIQWETGGTQGGGANEAHHNAVDRCTRHAAAFHRYMRHTLDVPGAFGRRLAHAVNAGIGREPPLMRKEHVKEGPLRTTVYKALLELTAHARRSGFSALTLNQVKSQVGRAGLQGVEAVLESLREFTTARPDEDSLVRKLHAFEQVMQAALLQMERVDGMRRRGAEVQLPVFTCDLSANDFLQHLTSDEFVWP
jgi:hypothetical protein